MPAITKTKALTIECQVRPLGTFHIYQYSKLVHKKV